MQQISNHVFCDDFVLDLKLDYKLLPNSYRDYPYLIIKNFLPKSTCNEISNYAYNSSEVKKAKVKTRLLGSVVNPSVDENIRKTVVHKLPKLYKNLYEQSFKLHQVEIERFFSVALTASTKIQTLEYTKGSFYIQHADDSNEFVNKDMKTVGYTQVAPRRKLSSVLFTTSHQNNSTDDYSFSGGELRFNYFFSKDGKQIDFIAEAGDMIVFPSNPIYSHEVLPIEDGYRLTLVQWHDGIIT